MGVTVPNIWRRLLQRQLAISHCVSFLSARMFESTTCRIHRVQKKESEFREGSLLHCSQKLAHTVLFFSPLLIHRIIITTEFLS